MNSGRFNIRVVVYVVLIAITSGLFLWAIGQDNKLVTSISLAMLWVVEIILLIRYVNKTNRDLLLFLQSFRFDDSSLVFNKRKNLPFKPLYDEFNRIIGQFRQLRIQKEIEHQYFEQVVQHAETGLIAWDHEEKIRLCNLEAKRILQIPHFGKLDGLKQIDPAFPDQLRRIQPGSTELFRILKGYETKNIYLRASHFRIGDEPVKLVSLQNIRPELEERESEAWQKLIKVLTHEMINSVGPVKLVSSSLLKMLEEKRVKTADYQLSPDEMVNLKDGLKAIHTRSLGLSRFVEDYQTLTEIPRPKRGTVRLDDLIRRVTDLLKTSYLADPLRLKVDIEPADLSLHADREMLEQVLINVFKNAARALEDHDEPLIEVRATLVDERPSLEIQDNGCGIAFNVLDYIFMPFFTTKKDGSGIGLTLARQIMKAHGGEIRLRSKEGEGTLVRLIF